MLTFFYNFKTFFDKRLFQIFNLNWLFSKIYRINLQTNAVFLLEIQINSDDFLKNIATLKKILHREIGILFDFMTSTYLSKIFFKSAIFLKKTLVFI